MTTERDIDRIAGRGVRRVLLSPLVVLAVDVTVIAASIALTDGIYRDAVIYTVLVPAWLALLGSYRRRIAPTLQADLLALLGALACPAFVLAVIRRPGTGRLVHDVPVTALAVVGGRLFSYQLQRTVRSRLGGGEPTVIVGAGSLGVQVAQVLMNHPAYGMRPVGFVDGYPDDGTLPLPVLGGVEDFDAIVRRTGAARVIVAFGSSRESDLVAVLRASEEARIEVHILPRLFEVGASPSGPDTDIVWGFPLQRAPRAALRGPAWRTKRIVDVGVSVAVLALCSPLMVLLAVAVKLTSRGPVLYSQPRVGQRGEIVVVSKFRSMRVSGSGDTDWTGAAARRVTPLGRIIRATSLDELPQLVSVVRGDMSLVGPRPERPHFHSQFDQRISRYGDRLRVPVGVTGWAQVHGLRGDTSIEERARFDNYYIEHWSLWFDVVILARTVSQVVKEVWRTVRPARGSLIGALEQSAAQAEAVVQLGVAALGQSAAHAEAAVHRSGALGHALPAEGGGSLLTGGPELDQAVVVEG